MSYNPKDYEEVKDRLVRLYAEHPDARVVTENLTTKADRAALTWVVRAEIHLPMWSIYDDWAAQPYAENNWYLKATGLAFEIDGKNGMANKTSALENCETSAIGRALANAGYSGSKNRASAEEMAKVARGITPSRDWITEAKAAKSIEELRKLYAEARQASAETATLATISDLAEAWTEQQKKSS
jgi:hypothetical protein